MAVVVINEIDYDQAGPDVAEFVELYNSGPDAVNLDTFTLVLVNGSNNTVYQTIPLAGTLSSGEFFVICGNGSITPNCDLDVTPESNLVQNGAPDAVALYNGTNLLDSVSYEGDVPGFVEVAGAPGDDNGTPYIGLSRLPDGADTDDNSADFTLRCITPGYGNSPQPSDCLEPVPVTSSSWGSMKSIYR